MKVLGVTLARGGSRRIPRKNVKEIAGKPLIAWTIEQALKAQNLTNYIVSSDDPEILEVSIRYGALVLERPKELAQDDTPSIDALQHAVKVAEEKWGKQNIIADIRCTNPTKTAAHIDGMIEYLIETQGDSVIGVGPAYPVERIKRLEDGLIKDILMEPADGQSQKLPESWIRNGSAYVLWRDVLMDGQLFGHKKSYGYRMPREYSVNIDDELDWALASLLLKARK